MSPDRIDLMQTDVLSHARSLTELTLKMASYETDKAVNEVKDEYLQERIGRIEAKIDAVYRLGWWLLAAFGTSSIALICNFAFRGGFYIAK